MIRTSGKIENFKPISLVGNNLYLICWDMKEHKSPEGDMVTWMEEMVRFKPSLEYVKNFILGWHNEQIDNKILSGFRWNEMDVWLSSENQFNYKAAFDLAIQMQGQNLPITFKFGTTNEPVYYTFSDLNDLQGFYLAAMKYINDTLAEGWQIKDSIDWDKYIIADDKDLEQH